MSISSSGSNQSYTANGAQTVFTVPFYFLADGDLVVFTTDVNGASVSVKTLTTDYTVSGAGDPAGGSITFLAAPANLVVVKIYRWVAPLQETDYANTGTLDAEILEQSLDRLTMLVQQTMLRVGGPQFSLNYTDVLGLSAVAQAVWNGENRRLSNIAAPQSSTDAVNKAYADAITTANGNVPTPSNPGDNSKVLTAGSGLFTWQAIAASGVPTVAGGDALKMLRVNAGETAYELRTPTQVRSDLSLGTAALLNVGTGANEIVQRDGGGSYPAGDGEAITGVLGASVVKIATMVASSSANINFDSTHLSGYSSYILKLDSIVPSVDARNVVVEFSIDNGLTMITSGYKVAGDGRMSSGTQAEESSAAAASIPLNDSGAPVGSDTGECLFGTYYILGLSGANNRRAKVQGQSAYNSSAGNLICFNLTGDVGVQASAINYMRIRMSADFIASGVFTLYGVI